jgi:hypothetical protein
VKTAKRILMIVGVVAIIYAGWTYGQPAFKRWRAGVRATKVANFQAVGNEWNDVVEPFRSYAAHRGVMLDVIEHPRGSLDIPQEIRRNLNSEGAGPCWEVSLRTPSGADSGVKFYLKKEGECFYLVSWGNTIWSEEYWTAGEFGVHGNTKALLSWLIDFVDQAVAADVQKS